MNFTVISEKIQNSFPLEFGSIFNRSIELFKKVWLQGFITLLLTMVTILPFYLLFYIPFIMAGITDPEMFDSENVPPQVLIPMIFLFPVLLIAVMTIGLALNAAFLRICMQKDFDQMVREDYFFFLKRDYLVKTITLSLLMFGVSILGMLACGIGIFYVMVPMAIMPAFLAFNEQLSPMEIVKASFKLGNKNWLVIFGLVLLMGILAELGILLCCVGIFFTAMLAKIPTYYIYKDGIGFPAIE